MEKQWKNNGFNLFIISSFAVASLLQVLIFFAKLRHRKNGKHRCGYAQKNRRQPSSNQDLGIPSILPCIACLIFPAYAVLYCSKIKYLQEV